jgi:hypothetical protein
MKRKINDVTYNTDTSTMLAQSRWERNQTNVLGVLYQTRGGAYFIHEEVTQSVWNEAEGRYEQQIHHTFVPISPDGARAWLLDGEVEIFNNPFNNPPEATEETQPVAEIYMRVPQSLKRRIDAAAAQAKVSVNVWAMRCIENCIKESDGRE